MIIGTRVFFAEILSTFVKQRTYRSACIRARPYRLRKNPCFVSGHDFSAASLVDLCHPGLQSGVAGCQTRGGRSLQIKSGL
jgi:hypothetical protein